MIVNRVLTGNRPIIFENRYYRLPAKNKSKYYISHQEWQEDVGDHGRSYPPNVFWTKL